MWCACSALRAGRKCQRSAHGGNVAVTAGPTRGCCEAVRSQIAGRAHGVPMAGEAVAVPATAPGSNTLPVRTKENAGTNTSEAENERLGPLASSRPPALSLSLAQPRNQLRVSKVASTKGWIPVCLKPSLVRTQTAQPDAPLPQSQLDPFA